MASAVDTQKAAGILGAIFPRMRVQSHSRGLALLSLVFLSGILALAQGVSGRIVGTLTDSSGAVIPNATVSITNQGPGTVPRVTSNANGDYRADNLPPGSYQVK